MSRTGRQPNTTDHWLVELTLRIAERGLDGQSGPSNTTQDSEVKLILASTGSRSPSDCDIYIYLYIRLYCYQGLHRAHGILLVRLQRELEKEKSACGRLIGVQQHRYPT